MRPALIKIAILAYVVGTVISFLATASHGDSAMPAHAPAASASAVPSSVTSLPATTLDGHSIDLAAVSGWKVIYFWSAACPCVRACEKYSFVPLADKYKGKVAFYAVATNGWDLSMPHAQIATHAAGHHLPFPVVLDITHKIATVFNAKVTPQTYVLDPSNRVVFHGMPDDSRRVMEQTGQAPTNLDGSYLATALAQGLSRKSITPSPIEEDGCEIAW